MTYHVKSLGVAISQLFLQILSSTLRYLTKLTFDTKILIRLKSASSIREIQARLSIFGLVADRFEVQRQRRR